MASLIARLQSIGAGPAPRAPATLPPEFTREYPGLGANLVSALSPPRDAQGGFGGEGGAPAVTRSLTEFGLGAYARAPTPPPGGECPPIPPLCAADGGEPSALSCCETRLSCLCRCAADGGEPSGRSTEWGTPPGTEEPSGRSTEYSSPDAAADDSANDATPYVPFAPSPQ